MKLNLEKFIIDNSDKLERFVWNQLNPKIGIIAGATLFGLTYLADGITNSKASENLFMISYSAGLALLISSAIEYGEQKRNK